MWFTPHGEPKFSLFRPPVTIRTCIIIKWIMVEFCWFYFSFLPIQSPEKLNANPFQIYIWSFRFFAIASKHECKFLTSLPVDLLHLDKWRKHGGFVRGTYLSVLPLFHSHSVPAGIESLYPKNVQVSSHQWWLSHLVIFESCNGTNHAGVPIRPQPRLVQASKKSSYLSIFSPISELASSLHFWISTL